MKNTWLYKYTGCELRDGCTEYVLPVSIYSLNKPLKTTTFKAEYLIQGSRLGNFLENDFFSPPPGPPSYQFCTN